MVSKENQREVKNSLPINEVEDVEFSIENADQDDLEAMERAEKADRRQQSQQS